MTRKKTKKLGDLIVEANLATRAQVEEAVQAQLIFGNRLGTNLVEMGVVDGDTLADFLSQQYQIPRASRQELDSVPQEARNLITSRAALRLGLLPLSVQEGRLILAMMNPGHQSVIERLSFHLGLKIEPRILTELELRYYVDQYYGIPREPRFSAILARFIRKDATSKMNLLHAQLDRHISSQEAAQYYFKNIRTIEKVPIKTGKNPELQRDLSSELIFLFLQVDGISTLEEIVANSPYPRIATLRAMVHFAKIGLIAFENA